MADATPKQTLTDRYIWAVQRSLPERQRDDIDKELRGSIADAADAKVGSGADPASAEHDAIAELGDPYRLASGYTDHPLYLIGPAMFPDYVRLLKILFAIVLPIAFACVLLGQILGHPVSATSVGPVIGGTIGITIALVAHLGFWPTLVFALIERSPKKVDLKWIPERLAQIPAVGAIKLSDTISGVFWYLVLIAGLLWAATFSLHSAKLQGDLSMLDSGVWWFWLPYFLALAAVALILEVVVYRMRNWNVPLLIVKMVIVAGYVVPTVTLLLSGKAFTENFFRLADVWPTFAPRGPGTTVLVFILVVLAVVDLGVAITRTLRARRAR